ncbi:16S rRNA (cytosine(967)-C(5))-methyltransferase RsmB [Syntrophomonas palmitatica]|uniref:16S rRNA (cytosine(967)-C(5))-methyltransferase RsmB n=1 Tax=Syntrophomonas palmitatica TaxID=402877 RepID=UPI000A8707E0|nr:16S rRNA (cytosine(967)-C(5))-methyltransferase RsmB [Syntrophomonas palmitatica]
MNLTINSKESVNPARVLAVQIVHDIMEEGLYANLALEKALRNTDLSLPDRRLLTEIVNGTIRMIKHLDWVLNQFLQKKIVGQNPWLRAILRISAYQLLFMDRIPVFACVNDAVNMSRLKINDKLSKVTNGVLRNLLRQRDNIVFPEKDTPEFMAVYYSHPEWMVKLFFEVYGVAETKRMLEYNNQAPPLVLRANTMLCDAQQLLAKLQADEVQCFKSSLYPQAIRITESLKPISNLEAYRQGAFYVQNEASMLAASILSPESGETVYDFCCGVGGKSSHMAELMQNRGVIRAYDLHPHKINVLQGNCQRLRVSIVEARAADICQLTLNDQADRILLDAPCSGLGVLNRRADSRWRKYPEDLRELQELQLRLLSQAGKFLKTDGLLLYATCTINPGENEKVVGEFLQNNNYKLQGFADNIDFFPLDSTDRARARQGMLTLLPGKYDTDGMFYALLRRTSLA